MLTIIHHNKNIYECDFENYRELCDGIFGNNFPNLILKLAGIGTVYALTAKLLAPHHDSTTLDTIRLFSVPAICHAATFYLFSHSPIAKKVDALIRAEHEWAQLEHHHARVAK